MPTRATGVDARTPRLDRQHLADEEHTGAWDPSIVGLARAGELRETLLAYLDRELDVQRTAASLHLHANSLRYRVGRIEEQLGRSLRDPATIANLYLAVLLLRASEGADRRER